MITRYNWLYYLIGFIASSLIYATKDLNTNTIILSPIWQVIESDTTKSSMFGGTWMLAGTITINKKFPGHVLIDHITLQWNGEYIPNLMASLYKKKSGKSFMPVDHLCIGDANWNPTSQTLTFFLGTKIPVYQILYFVITIPKQLENRMQHGFFQLKKDGLPEAFHPALAHHNPILVYTNRSTRQT